MPKHFESFAKLMEDEVLLLHQKHPEKRCLKDIKNSQNLTVFATFQFEGKKWRVNSDTHLEKLVQAYKMHIAGDEPFIISTTPKGKTARLLLSKQKNNKPNGLYIYQNRK